PSPCSGLGSGGRHPFRDCLGILTDLGSELQPQRRGRRVLLQALNLRTGAQGLNPSSRSAYVLLSGPLGGSPNRPPKLLLSWLLGRRHHPRDRAGQLLPIGSFHRQLFFPSRGEAVILELPVAVLGRLPA